MKCSKSCLSINVCEVQLSFRDYEGKIFKRSLASVYITKPRFNLFLISQTLLCNHHLS